MPEDAKAPCGFRPIRVREEGASCIRIMEEAFALSFGSAERFHGEDGEGQWRYLADLEERVERDPRSAAHLWHEGELIGQIELFAQDPEDPRPGGLVALYYLAPEWRGKGLMASMEAYAEAYFRGWGVQEARLTVSLGNERAIQAYRKHGWEDGGIWKDPAGLVEDMLTMRKPYA